MPIPQDTVATPPFTATVLRRHEDFLALEPEWRALFEASERPLTYQRHRWLRLCWELVWRRPWNRLRIILIRDSAGTLVMAGIFVIYFYRLVPTVEFLNSRMPQTEDLLWRPSPDTAAQAGLLLDTLAKSVGVAPMLRVLRLRDDSPLKAAVIARGLRRRIKEELASPYLPLSRHPDFESYFATLSHNIRVDHRRRLRRLGEMPGFSYRHDTGDTALEAMRWAFDTKREWLVQRQHTAKWLSSGLVDRFMTAYLDAADDVPETWFASLRIGDRIIASTICFIERDLVMFFKIAHDPDYGKQSPGRTLTLNEIEHAYGRGLAEFDFGQGTIEWKRRLTDAERLVTSERIWFR